MGISIRGQAGRACVRGLDELAKSERCLRAERAARLDAERQAARLGELQVLAAAYSASDNVDDVVGARPRVGRRYSGAASASIFVFGADRSTLNLLGAHGVAAASPGVGGDSKVTTGRCRRRPRAPGRPYGSRGRRRGGARRRGRRPFDGRPAAPWWAAASSRAMTLGFHGSRLSDDERSFAVMAAEHVARAARSRALALDRAGAWSRGARAPPSSQLAKDEFLSTLGHELRTPLTSILGGASILRRRAVEPALARGLRGPSSATPGRRSRLLEDVLDVSRIVTGKLRLSIRTVDPAAVVHPARST